MDEDRSLEELLEAERVEEREPTVIELMNGPHRPSERSKQTVLWISLAFVGALFALTFGVMTFYGVSIIGLFTLVGLGFVAAAMIGAIRYKGEDPMAQFDPPREPKSKFFWLDRDEEPVKEGPVEKEVPVEKDEPEEDR